MYRVSVWMRKKLWRWLLVVVAWCNNLSLLNTTELLHFEIFKIVNFMLYYTIKIVNKTKKISAHITSSKNKPWRGERNWFPELPHHNVQMSSFQQRIMGYVKKQGSIIHSQGKKITKNALWGSIDLEFTNICIIPDIFI